MSSFNRVILIAVILSGASIAFSQCPTSGTITTNCTSSSYSLTGNVTVNSGVVVTITGEFELNGGRIFTATGATINLGSFKDTWTGGGTNVLTGGTYNVTNNFITTSGGNFTANNINVTVGGNFSADPGSATHSYNNSSFAVNGSGYFGSTVHNINNTSFSFGQSLAGTTGVDMLSLNGGADLLMSNGASIAVRGDVNAGNSAQVYVDNSSFTVTGNYDNAGQGDVDVVNNGSFIVGGTYDNSGTGHTNINSDGYMEVGTFNNTNGDASVNGGTLVVNDSFIGTTPGGDAGDCTGGGGGCCGTGCSALPVVLLDFRGEILPLGVELSWSTLTEVSNDFFTIEKSYDGSEFFPFAKVKGSGDSQVQLSYKLQDNERLADKVFYRLSQTDFDGTTEYLKVVVIGSASNSFEMSVYPTSLTTDSQFITVQGATADMSWKVYNLNGALVDCGSFIKSNEVQIYGLGKGVYFLHITSSIGSVSSNKFIVK